MEEGKNDLAREADLAESGERFQFGHISSVFVKLGHVSTPAAFPIIRPTPTVAT